MTAVHCCWCRVKTRFIDELFEFVLLLLVVVDGSSVDVDVALVLVDGDRGMDTLAFGRLRRDD